MKKVFILKNVFFLFAIFCAYPKIANAETITTFDTLLATGTLTVGDLNLLSFRTAGISSFTTAGISSFTVPSGVSKIFVKTWGGGGGGGGMSNCNTYRAGNGAGGSFASGLIDVSSGEVLTILVGFGGVSTGVFGGIAGLPGGQGLSSTAGGSGGTGGSGSGIGSAGNGGGGAASGVFRVTASTVGLVVAGGGGAGGGFIYNVGPNGGSASAQGVGGAGNADGTAGASSGAGGGGGGGGATSGGTGGGGGLGGTTGNSIGTTIIYGSGMTAGNTSDVDYSSAYPSTGVPNGNETVGVGTGGQGGFSSCYGENGNSGAVVLYNVHAASAAATILGGLSVLSTVTIGGYCSGMWCTVASSQPVSGSTSILFSALSSSNSYHIRANLITQTTAGYYFMRFNGDSGSVYKYSSVAGTNGGSFGAGSGSATYCLITPATAAYFPNIGDPLTCDVYFSTWNRGQKKAVANFECGSQFNSGDYGGTRGTCIYSNGDGAVTSVEIGINGGGTMIGDARLESWGK